MQKPPQIVIGINEGINASVVIAERGRIIFALEEERVSLVKGDIGFPTQALTFAIDYLGLDRKDVSHVCFSNQLSPRITKAEFLATYEWASDARGTSILSSIDEPLRRMIRSVVPQAWREARRQRLRAAHNLLTDEELKGFGLGHVEVVRTHHHFNHAASAYYGLQADPDQACLVLSLDGGGDDACSHVYLAREGRMELIAATPIGHSLGNIYSRVTHLMGFTPHEHEYKLMGLAPYTDARYIDPVVAALEGYLDLDPNNPLRFRRLIPEPTSHIGRRLADDFRRVRFDVLAAGLQAFTEDLIVRWVRATVEKTGVHKVLAAGGVFMNIRANKLIAELPEIESFDVFPSCGDETLPFGAVWHLAAETGTLDDRNRPFDIYLGPDVGFDLEDTRKRYDGQVTFTALADPVEKAAELLDQGEVVAWCQGRMEFGARALGNRSLLAVPGRPGVTRQINRMIKSRDFWMPFAPAIRAEDVETWVQIPPSLPDREPSPWMMHSFDATTKGRQEMAGALHGYDGTARAQIVTPEYNPLFHALLGKVGEVSGNPVLLNTSFNLHGYPLVMGTRDAIEILLGSGLRYLIVNDVLVTKPESVERKS